MGRPERPLDPRGSGPVRDLAEALRAVRRSAGTPSYRRLAGATRYSAATLARAAAGTVLPTREVTVAYATACGGDQTEWEERWQRAFEQEHEAGAADGRHRPAGAPQPPATVEAP